MILIIDLCFEKDSLHYNEFVKPVENIVKKITDNYNIIHYLELNKEIIENSNKIIICGAALKDNEFIKEINKFIWIEEFEKPILGICAGAQIIAKTFKSEVKKGLEIGLIKPEKIKEDIILEDEKLNEAYALHSYSFEIPEEFELIAKTKYPQIIKKNKIYGILFHPEVRNHCIIENFIKKVN